jgi:hypothetical protein
VGLVIKGEKVEETKPAVEWHKFKDKHVMMQGDKVLAIVEPVQDFPCEAFGVEILQQMYVSLDAAKADAEACYAGFLRRHTEDARPQPNFYLDILRQVVTALEAKEKA